MEALKAIWTNLVSNYSDDKSLTEKLWVEIEKQYTTKKRSYHNLDHLNYMFDRASSYKHKLIDPDLLSFSIFYHDVIYNPKQNNNEEKSAEVAKDRLKILGLPSDKIVQCENQIMATKNHIQSTDNDTTYLVDFDLAILGDSSDNYIMYSKKIRKEYAVYPDFLYNPGRRKVLQHFLEMETIFKTTDFRMEREAQARKNMNEELLRLK